VNQKGSDFFIIFKKATLGLTALLIREVLIDYLDCDLDVGLLLLIGAAAKAILVSVRHLKFYMI